MRILRITLPVLALVLLGSCTGGNHVKYADKYGFLPDNDPIANSEALQRCLDGGGKIHVRKAGEYQICRTMLIDSGTDLQFADGVILSKALDPEGTGARHIFLNRGALTREWNERITISGLNIRCNGLDQGTDIPAIVGLASQVAFFYVKDLNINNFTMLDLPAHDFGIQICTFERATMENVHIEGMKDAVHFGPGKGFVVRHGIF